MASDTKQMVTRAGIAVPRRICVDLQTPTEAAIRAAIQAVEQAPAHPRMTDAVLLLAQALDAVADAEEALNPSLATATPPTPDRAAVREALDTILANALLSDLARLADALGVGDEIRRTDASYLDDIARWRRVAADALLRPAPLPADVQAAVAHADLMAGHAEALARETENPAMRETYARNASSLRALLTAVSRPAEARGEPWGYACRVRYTDNVASDWWIRFRTEELPTSHQAQVIPLYTHPAPSGGEALSKRVVRNEPGVMEIHVEARQVLRDGPMRVECWWSDEDGAYIASLADDEEQGRPFTATHTGIGATREEALAHLAVAEYVTALAVAAPRPETGEVRDIREARLAPLRSVAVQVMKLGRTCSRDKVIEIVHEMMGIVHREEAGA